MCTAYFMIRFTAKNMSSIFVEIFHVFPLSMNLRKKEPKMHFS